MKLKDGFILFAQIFLAILFLLLVVGINTARGAAPTNAGRPGSGARPVDIIRDPADVPPPIASRPRTVAKVTLTAKEVLGTLDPSAGTTYRYWTFNGKVPGPMIRVRQGDTVEVTLQNDPSSHMAHSIDLHAALGPGGGAALSQTTPGQSKTFTFKATTAGLFVYHCGTPMIAEHMANGMYGLILVEPENGLSHVDHEYYIVQGEIYTAEPKGKEGLQQFSAVKLMAEKPEYFVFNGAVDALTTEHPMPAKVGQTVRVFFGNAGPNQTSSSHVVGEIFTKVYENGSLTAPPMTNVQTVGVPPGSAAVLEFVARKPGNFALMDHSIARMAKGLMAAIAVSGSDDANLMHAGPATSEQIAQASVQGVTGMTQVDAAQGEQPIASVPAGAAVQPATKIDTMSMLHMGMEMDSTRVAQGIQMTNHARRGMGDAALAQTLPPSEVAVRRQALNGCLTGGSRTDAE